jgi:hypothetical protein
VAAVASATGSHSNCWPLARSRTASRSE